MHGAWAQGGGPAGGAPGGGPAGGAPRGGTAGGAPGRGPAGELTERDRAILAFERRWWRYAGAKEQAIRERLGMSATRYYQLLNAALDKPAALAHDPLLVKRLRRLRSARQRQRYAPTRLGAYG